MTYILIDLKNKMEISRGFGYIASSDSKILILGSLPSVISIEKQEYYGNPRNQFWKILFKIFNEEFSDNFEVRKNLILRNNLALWDILDCAERQGSLDSAIRNAKVNDIEKFLLSYNKINKIILNGTGAKKYYDKNFLNLNVKSILLPSTSPMRGKNVKSYEEKFTLWKQALTGE